MRNKTISLVIGFGLVLGSAGCGTGYRACSQASLVSVRRPVFTANAPETNAAALAPRSEGGARVEVPVGAPVQIYAEQVLVMFYGGTAASNSVLSGIEIPLVK